MGVKSLKLALVAVLATGLDACQRERRIHNHSHVKRALTQRAPLTADERLIISSFDNNSISDWSYYYTHGLHVAGTNESQAQWTADRWSEAGIPSTRLDTYNVFLNYPINKSMIMTYANGSVFTPALVEDILPEDDTTSYPNRVPTFHGYSFSGAASGEFVYVGRGQQVDFDALVSAGVELEGKIAISRYGGPFRGLKVRNAQSYGMIGAILFTDPADDGNVTVANGYAAYPDGPARNPTSVQRGSVQFLSTYPGDPTTPGYPSIGNDVVRADKSSVVPQIPSIPISQLDAEPILAALNDHGTPGRQVDRPTEDWVGGLNATYSTGPSTAVIDMSNYMQDNYTDIWNAIGVINGTSPDETVIIGNHYDAWIIGGAADPNSGSAVMIELGRTLGRLLATGWQPRRNIVLCSWDAEEYGLVGSTEWVEQYIPWISGTVVSYLNIDGAASGPHPDISATPELHEISIEMMKKVMWMDMNQTMYDVWMDETEGEVGVLGSGSDYTAFLHNGIASIDMGAGGDPSEFRDPIYHYHSNYDSYHWMSTYGDPEFLAHKSMGQYLTLLAYHIASEPSLPLNVLNYADQMDIYYTDLQEVISTANRTIDTSELRQAIDTFRTQAQEAQALEQQAMSMGDEALLEVVNRKKRDFQRGFVSQGGLPGREFYKHVVFAPGLDTGYAPVTFPGITEQIEAGDFDLAEQWVERTAAAIRVAGDILKT